MAQDLQVAVITAVLQVIRQRGLGPVQTVMVVISLSRLICSA